MGETLTAATSLMGRRWESSTVIHCKKERPRSTSQDPCNPTMWNVHSSLKGIPSCIDMSPLLCEVQLMTIIHPRLSLTPTRAPLHVQRFPQPMSRNGHDQGRLDRRRMLYMDATLMPLLGSAATCRRWSTVGTSGRVYRQEGSRG